MKILILSFFLISSLAWSKNSSTHESIAALLEEVRDPIFSSQQRRNILDFSRKMMAQKLSSEMGVSQDELNIAFVKNPTKVTHLMQDPWYDVQTQFYTTLHQENFNQRWQDLQKLVKFSEYGKSIQSTMMAHYGHYSASKEGRYYIRWSKISINSGGRSRNFTIPYFLMSSNIQDLIRLEAHVPYEELLPSTDLSPSRPGLQTFLKNTQGQSRLQRQELSEKMELNQKIYIRALANAAKTIASIHFLTGSLNRHQTDSKVSSFIDAYCDGCSMKQKKEYKISAMDYVDQLKNTLSSSSLTSIVNNFCSSLRSNQYHWNINRLKPTPLELLADQTKLANYYVIHKLKAKNREALARTILDQDFGILFLTNAINLLDKGQEPVGTKLQCTSSSSSHDQNMVKAAIREAETNIQNYLVRINRKLMSGRFNLAKTNETLEYFVQTNQAASIEATAHYPQGIGWILKSVAILDQNITRREKIDTVITWGGTILGVGLTLTGIGAPEGVAILVSTAGLIKGVSAGSYFLVRSRQEKEFARELQLAKRGSSGNSAANFKHHYSSYKSLKIQYIKEFGAAGLSFVSLHRMALNRTNGDVVKAHGLMKKAAEAAKETGKEQVLEQLQDFILGAVIGT